MHAFRRRRRAIPSRSGARPRPRWLDGAGFVETPRLYLYMSARANLEALATLDRRAGADRIPELLQQVELADRARSKVREFSDGMVQRLGVARR
jgi:ABC-type multidrug transport system ATPase subunit